MALLSEARLWGSARNQESWSHVNNGGTLTNQPTVAPSVENRLLALEAKTVLPGPPVSQTTAKDAWTIALSGAAILISLLALAVPFWIQSLDVSKELNAEQRAAIGPVLGDVSVAENKLWDAKIELSANQNVANEALKAEVEELHDAYLEATYQVLPHGGLAELSAMNRLTQVVLGSGYSPEEGQSEVKISQSEIEAHEGAVSDFHRTFRCAVNVQDRRQCDG